MIGKEDKTRECNGNHNIFYELKHVPSRDSCWQLKEKILFTTKKERLGIREERLAGGVLFVG